MEFIVFGGVIFWILTAGLLITLFTSIHHERGTWATAGLVVYFIVLALFGAFDLTGFIGRNPIMLLVILGSYFLCGIAWTFIKWHFYVSDAKRKFDDYKADWLEGRGITSGSVPDEMKSEWTSAARTYAESQRARGSSRRPTNSYGRSDLRTGTQIIEAIKPKVRWNKSRIIFWLSYWPFSFLYTIFADGIAAIWNSIYHGIGKRLQAISDRKFKGADADFE